MKMASEVYVIWGNNLIIVVFTTLLSFFKSFYKVLNCYIVLIPQGHSPFQPTENLQFL